MQYIALFRGINVGGKNTVKMAELRGLFAGLGFTGVQSTIQSGNVVFSSDETEGAVRAMIGGAFRTAFGFDCAVMLRTREEWAAVVAGLPFDEKEIGEARAANADVEHLYVYFSNDALPEETVNPLCEGTAGPDLLRAGGAGAGGRELYLLCRESIRDSNLAASLAKLGVPLTARNWKTVSKLLEMPGDKP